MSFLSEKRHKYSNFYNTNKEYYLWFEDFPTPAFLRFSSVDMYISTKNILFVAVRNACIDHLRRISLEQEFADKRVIQLKLDELSFYDGADELFMRKDLMAHVMAKINELPEKRREIFLLSYMEGLKAAEIAERLNLSTRTVENQLYRTLLFLRKELQTAFVYLFMFV